MLTVKEKNSLTQEERLIQFYRDHPVEAAKDLLGVELVWLQRVALRKAWKSRFFMLLLTRGLGKTWLSAVIVVLYGLLYPKTKIGVIAPVLRQASYMFDYIEELYNESPYIKVATRKFSRSLNREYIEFKNGSYIEGLPLGDGNRIRGRRYHFVIIDEYSQVPEQIIILVIRPMMNIKRRGINNKLIISGTAYYPWNHYYKQYLIFNVMSRLRPDLYSFVEYDYEDLLVVDDPPYQIDIQNLEMMKASSTHDEFMMENKNLFPVVSSGFFPAKLIDTCTPTLKEGSPIEEIGRVDKKYVIGVDAARVEGGDNFIIQVLRIDGMVKRLVKTVKMNGASYPEMAAAVRNICVNFNVVRVFLDALGGGLAIYDLISKPWVDPVTGKIMPAILNMDDKDTEGLPGMRYLKFIIQTMPLNSEIFHGLKSEMEHNRMLFPMTRRRDNDPNIESILAEINQTKQELMMLIAEGTGIYFKFSAPSGRKKDRAVALALANAAAKDYLNITPIVQKGLASGRWI